MLMQTLSSVNSVLLYSVERVSGAVFVSVSLWAAATDVRIVTAAITK